MCHSATFLSAASVCHWLNQCQMLCSLPTHHATRSALHTGTVLCLPAVSKYLPPWLDKNLTSRPNSTSKLEGRKGVGVEQQKQHNNEKHFVNYVAMSPKYRLPTWRLRATKTPTTRNVSKLPVSRSGCWYSKWFGQWPLLSRKQRRSKKSAPTFTASLLGVCFCCWRQEVDDWISAGNEDRVLAEFWVEMMAMQMIVLLMCRWWCWC